ncbi:MAG TPA: DUF3857 domain-containing protein [Pseudomonadota bacterium]|nr:DUF3857 domain-containing protein [Pseudomonadota bacterium]
MPTNCLCGLAFLFAFVSASWAQTPFDQEVQERNQRFSKEAGTPGSVVAVIPLLGLSDLSENVVDRKTLQDLSKQASGGVAKLSELVRAEALWHDLSLRHQLADKASVADGLQKLGLLTAFSIVGPFDNDGQKGHSTAYPPETETTAPSPSARYSGKNPSLPLSYRLVPSSGLSRDGSVPLDAWMRPETDGTAYAVTYVRSEQRQTVAVRVGASGAVKVFVNLGAPTIDADVYRKLHLDQEANLATLLPGWNRILVKISSHNSRWAFVLRFTTPDGKPLVGVTHTAAPPAENWKIPVAVPAIGQKPATLLSALRGRLKNAKPNTPQAAERAAQLTDLGLYLHHAEPGNPEQHEAETVLAEAVVLAPSHQGYRILAEATDDDNKKRLALEAGLALPGDDQKQLTEKARMWVEVGLMNERASRIEQANQAFSEAARLEPKLYTATLGMARLLQARGMPGLAVQKLRALAEGVPSVAALRAYADELSKVGRDREAHAVYQNILQIQPSDEESFRFLIARKRAAGQVEEALELLGKCAALRPDAQWPVREAIDLLEGAGQLEAALQKVLAAAPQFVGDAEWLERRGRLLLKLKRTELAVASFRRSLELKPQNPSLREYLQAIDPAARSAEDLQRKFQQDLDALLKKPRPKPTVGDSARVLFDQKVVRIHSNGLSEEYNQRVVEILDDAGAREYDEVGVTFTPDTQSVQFKTAKVIKPNGDVVESVSQSETNASEPWYGLYYDLHAVSVRFDGLRPGDVVVVEHTRSDVGRRNLFSDYFGDVTYLQESIPVLEARYVLTLPEEDLKRRPLYFNKPHLLEGATLTRTDEVVGQEHIIRFVAQNLPKIHDEAGRPGYAELSAYIHVSTYKTWDDVATWYKGLVAESLVASPEVTKAAQVVIAKIPASDELGRIRALYNEVVRRTRYVGLEFGIHGYKPYKVAQVWERKFGDCKDKAALLHVMLKEVGIESSMVLARTTKGGNIDAEPASLSVFDHAIVFVPKYNLYLDGTAEFSGSMELPSMDQDTIVLVVSDPRPPYLGKGHLARTPVLPSSQSVTKRVLSVLLDESGKAKVSEQLSVSGQNASRMRDQFQNPSSQKERHEKAWNETFPGAQVREIEIPDVLNLEKAVTVRAELSVPKWGRPPSGSAQKALALLPLGREPDLLRSYARLSHRQYDLILGFAWVSQEEITVHLPPRFAVQRLPASSELESPFGRFSLRFEQRPGKNGIDVIVKSELRIDRHRLSAMDYPSFRTFLSGVDRALAQELLVGRE